MLYFNMILYFLNISLDQGYSDVAAECWKIQPGMFHFPHGNTIADDLVLQKQELHYKINKINVLVWKNGWRKDYLTRGGYEFIIKECVNLHAAHHRGLLFFFVFVLWIISIELQLNLKRSSCI